MDESVYEEVKKNMDGSRPYPQPIGKVFINILKRCSSLFSCFQNFCFSKKCFIICIAILIPIICLLSVGGYFYSGQIGDDI